MSPRTARPGRRPQWSAPLTRLLAVALTLAPCGCRAAPTPLPTSTAIPITAAPPPTPPVTATPTPLPTSTAIRITAAPPPTPTPLPPQAWAALLAEGVLARWPDPQTIVGHGWEYNTGIVLVGLAAVLIGLFGATLATFGYETVVNLLGKAGIGKRA